VSVSAQESRSILCTTHHLSQFVFTGEVCLEAVEFSDEVTRGGKHGLLRSNLAVCLDPEFELGKERMRNLDRVISIEWSMDSVGPTRYAANVT
jgi:hypothetical protein